MPTLTTVPITGGTVVPATIGKVFGGSYATVFIEHDGTTYECPVMLGALLVHDEYKAAWDRRVEATVKPGDQVDILVTGGAFQTPTARLPVVEILTIPDARALSLDALSKGWALPNDYALQGASNRTLYIHATLHARVSGNGIWRDEALRGTFEEAMSRDLWQATKPQGGDFLMEWKGAMYAVVVAVVIFLAWQHYQRFLDPVAAAQREATEKEDEKRSPLGLAARKTGRFFQWAFFTAPGRLLPRWTRTRHYKPDAPKETEE